MRQDFNDKIKRLLGERVAYMCSNPLCRKLTIKPNPINDFVVKSGKACHIYPASTLGPRNHERANEISDNDIKSFKNGIWLCDTCAREIDDNKDQYSAEKLIEWKKEAEKYVEELVTQDTRLRQLRTMLFDTLTTLRILNALPNHFDQTFENATGIGLTRTLIENEQILFENSFPDEANVLMKIYKDLEEIIYPEIKVINHIKNEYLDISLWKNEVINVLMIKVMRFSVKSYERYLERETKMVEDRKIELLKNKIKPLNLSFTI